MENDVLEVVLCWHMHQPHYRDELDGSYHLPWVYLHGIKDYSDMAAHLENNPKMQTVVNFSPVLLEQIDSYVKELELLVSTKFESDKALSDPMLNLLAGLTEIPSNIESRKQIVEDCRRCHAPRMIDPYPAFAHIISLLDCTLDKKDDSGDMPYCYLEEQYFIDLLVWYHLAWLGHSIKQSQTAKALINKQYNYSKSDRQTLITLIYDTLKGLIPRYKQLAENKQIELSFTPYTHPIVPLLNDFENMRCSLPDAPAPNCENYPDGVNRSHWHIQTGIDIFQKFFGFKPKGMWLSEGGVSDDALEMLDQYDIAWTATGEAVWRNTYSKAGYSEEEINSKKALFSAHQFKETKSRIFFRDDGLSDLIGFEYSHWNAEDAAKEFVSHLENIATFLKTDESLEDKQKVVSIILDGENAWEYYIDNGYHFLDALYKEISSNKHLKVTTFEQVCDKPASYQIDELCAGSWVYGSFSTWIGENAKNRAWELLVDAKTAFDQKIASNELDASTISKATNQLAVCEGSDWFWWFGDYNSADSVNDFDKLYRKQLTSLYELLQLSPPIALEKPISKGGGQAENAGTMRRNT